MGVKPGYKQTDVGVIPEDWEVRELGELTTLMTNGFVGKATDYYTDSDGGVLYIQGFNVEENSYNFTGIKRVTPEFHRRHSKSRLLEGDLLTIQTGDIGLTTIVTRELEGSNCHALVISRFASPYDPKYVSYYFNSPTGRARFKDIETGSTMKHLNVGDLRTWLVPLPPLPEQRAIAAALSDVDALVAALDALIAKKRDIKQGTMQQLLTGKTRLPGFSGAWEVRPLGEIGQCLRGVSYDGETDLSPYDTDSTIRLLRSNNVQNGSVLPNELQFVASTRVSSRQLLQPGDIVICMANGSKDLVGKAGSFQFNDEFRYTFGAFMGCFRPSSAAKPAFVSILFQTSRYRDYIARLLAGSSINNMRRGDIESLSFPFPSLAEQTAIATVLTDMDAEIAALERRRAKTVALKQGMMQELLTGKVRLL